MPNSRLLDVTFSTTDPKLAAQIVNAHVSNFIEQNFRSRYEATTQASNWLAGQLDELKSKVETSEDARINYERANQIWTIDEKQDVTTQKLADINKELTEAQADRINKEAVYQLAQAGNYDAIPAVRESPVIQDILKQQSDSERAVHRRPEPVRPEVSEGGAAQEQIKDLDQLVTARRRISRTRSRPNIAAPASASCCCSRRSTSRKTEASAMADKMVQYNILKRDAEANKQLYDGLLQKLKEAGITAGFAQAISGWWIRHLFPTAPSKPQKSRNISLAILVGLVGGIGLALLREYMDNTVKNPDDVENWRGCLPGGGAGVCTVLMA